MPRRSTLPYSIVLSTHTAPKRHHRKKRAASKAGVNQLAQLISALGVSKPATAGSGFHLAGRGFHLAGRGFHLAGRGGRPTLNL